MHLEIQITLRGTRCRLHNVQRRLKPDNDTAELIRANLPDLRQREKAILSDIACGDTEETSAWKELAVVRRSILACGGQGVLRIA